MAPSDNAPPRRRMTGSNAAKPAGPRLSGASRAFPGPAAPPPGPPAEATGDQSGPRLTCTAGPAAGAVFPLSGDENVIGRATGLEVHVLDGSLSRKHAIVRRTDAGWTLSDLGSGNGTQLNGEPVEADVALQSGDSIAVGDTVFTFSDGADEGGGAGGEAPGATGLNPSDTAEGLPAAGPAPRRRPPVRTSRALGRSAAPARRERETPAAPAALRKRAWRMRAIGVGATLLLLLALALGWRAIRGKDDERFREALRRDQARLADYGRARGAAMDDFRKGLWDSSKRRLEELQANPLNLEVRAFPPRPESRKLVEDASQEQKLVADNLTNLEKEQPHLDRLAEAQKAISKGDLLAASKALQAISTSNSQLRERRDALNKRVEEAVDAKVSEAAALFRSAPTDKVKLEQVKRTAEEVLAVAPEHRDALALRREVEGALQVLQQGKGPRTVDPTDPVEGVKSAFRAGDVAGAKDLAGKCAAKNANCKKLLGLLGDFEQKLRGADGGSEADVLALFELDSRISGSTSLSGSIPKALRLKAAAAFYKKAAGAATAANWRRAVEYAQACQRGEPGHLGCAQVLENARRECKNVYMRGYVLKDTQPDDAAKLFREVMAMCPPGDEQHDKAKIRLEELKN